MNTQEKLKKDTKKFLNQTKEGLLDIEKAINMDEIVKKMEVLNKLNEMNLKPKIQ